MNIRTVTRTFFLFSLILFFYSCSGNQKNYSENQEIEHNQHEAQSIVSLTKEQIQSVGIILNPLEIKELTATISANGVLKVPNGNKANVTSFYGGAVRTINVQVGDFVKKGQTVATIANPQFIQLQEEYLTVCSKAVFAEQELQRQQQLADNEAGAKKNLQSAAAELNALKTRKASLHQQIQLMGINPNMINNGNLKAYLTITSPISGTVSSVFAQIGSYVDVASPVVEVVDNGSLHLDLNVFEKDLPLLEVGQTIHFTVTNNPTQEYDAQIFSIGTAFENDSKTIPVHANVSGNKAGLIDGMNVTGIVSLSNAVTPAVPSEAIVNSDGKNYIFVQTDKQPENRDEHSREDNVNFEKIEVFTGVSNMGYTAITPVKKLAEHDKIAVKGAFFINAKMTNSGGHEH
ncbi:MAG: efflux RND transporter periplasmic adaptor subunit [Prevotellaceae bacterium]|jgi:RND family efflux transporter MFP subunit|nr:efflux RND transporter periplasmic adaptor subunit [Prevotellaceae bacterium]